MAEPGNRKTPLSRGNLQSDSQLSSRSGKRKSKHEETIFQLPDQATARLADFCGLGDLGLRIVPAEQTYGRLPPLAKITENIQHPTPVFSRRF